jgi:sodium/bile acid cotransporter 7
LHRKVKVSRRPLLTFVAFVLPVASRDFAQENSMGLDSVVAKRACQLWERLRSRWFVVTVGLGVLVCLLEAEAISPWLGKISPRWNIALVTLLTTLGLPLRQLLAAALRPGPVLWALFISYGVLPVGGLAAGWLFRVGGYPEYGVGIVVCTAVPCTLASAAIWTRLAGGNEATAIVVTVVSSNTAWLFTTSWLAFSLGAEVSLNAWLLMADLLFVLVGPLVIAQLLRTSTTVRRLAERGRSLLSVLARLLILMVILQAVTMIGLRLGENAWREELFPVLLSLVVAPGLHLAALVMACRAHLLRFDRGQRIAVALPVARKLCPSVCKSPPLTLPTCPWRLSRCFFTMWGNCSSIPGLPTLSSAVRKEPRKLLHLEAEPSPLQTGSEGKIGATAREHWRPTHRLLH